LPAESPEAALNVLKDYLKVVDDFQNREVKNIRYDMARSLFETRISLVYQELGDSQSARTFMDRAVWDYQHQPHPGEIKEPADDSTVEKGLKGAVAKIDGWNSIDWQKNTKFQFGTTNEVQSSP